MGLLSMCMKYEEKYDQCFDFMFFEGGDESLIVFLREHYGIEITDNEKFEMAMMAFWADMHEKGIIKPCK